LPQRWLTPLSSTVVDSPLPTSFPLSSQIFHVFRIEVRRKFRVIIGRRAQHTTWVLICSWPPPYLHDPLFPIDFLQFCQSFQLSFLSEAGQLPETTAPVSVKKGTSKFQTTSPLVMCPAPSFSISSSLRTHDHNGQLSTRSRGAVFVLDPDDHKDSVNDDDNQERSLRACRWR